MDIIPTRSKGYPTSHTCILSLPLPFMNEGFPKILTFIITKTQSINDKTHSMSLWIL